MKTLSEHRARRENVPTKVGIYKIINPNNEVYIGSSKSIYRRWYKYHGIKV